MSKFTYFNEKINSSNNNRNIWKVLKEALPHKQHRGPEIKISSQEFNNFFSTIGQKLTSKHESVRIDQLPKTLNTPAIKFEFTQINVNTVLSQLLTLNNNSELDFLDFDEKLLRLSALLIAPMLTHIHVYDLSLCQGTLPDDWKTAKGDPDSPENYRPIFIILPTAKIFGKLWKNQIVAYLTSANILSPYQSAYIKYNSTQTALHFILEECMRNINHGFTNISVDLSEGFDILNQTILLNKLYNLGISGNSHDWFVSYLSNRKQFVINNHNMSETNIINISVPQRTVLGPILFILCVNDIFLCASKCTIMMYADDTTVICKGLSENELLRDMQSSFDLLSN